MPPLSLEMKLGLQRGGGISLLPETKAHQARVVADSGEILDIKQLNEDIKTLMSIGNGTLWAKFYQLLIAHGGVRLANTNQVVKWYDIISNKDVAETEATASTRPLIVVSNGIRHLYFDGSNDRLRGLYGESVSQPCSRIIVAKKLSAKGGGGVYSSGGGTVRLWRNGENPGKLALITGAGAPPVTSITDTLNNVSVHYRFSSTANDAFLSVYDATRSWATTTGSTGTTSPNGLTLGMSEASTPSLPVEMELYCHIQLKSDQPMTVDERTAFAGWLKSRYGIEYTGA